VFLKRLLATGNPFVVTELAALEEQLQELETQRLDSIKVRSKARWIEEGEKPTKFFFSLVRSHTNFDL
jgi:hypothetical protein